MAYIVIPGKGERRLCHGGLARLALLFPAMWLRFVVFRACLLVLRRAVA